MFGEIVQVVSSDGAWAKSMQGMQDLPESQASEARRGILSDPMYILGHYDAFPVQLLEAEDVEGTISDVVLVWVDEDAGEWVKLYFDPNSGALVRTQSKGKHPFTQAPGIQDNYYSELTEMDGVVVGKTQRMLHDGEEVMGFVLQSFEVNPTIDDALFVKPSS
jgi:hypothetical protein